jgi:type I restriction enzyme S subunit
MKEEFRRATMGSTHQTIYMPDIRRLAIPIPPRSEQVQIVRFLRKRLPKVDELIAKKERLVALLTEKRQALVTQAVTKGLDPIAPMKDSGQAVLPTVPAHWRILPLRHLLSFGPKNGISPPPSDTDGVLSFSIAAVREGRVTIDGHEKYVELDARLRPSFELHPGDILLMRGSGNLELVGTCGLVEDVPTGCTYPDILMRMRPDETTRADFLVAAVNSPYVRGQIETAAKTSNGTYKVSGEDIRALIVAAPPRSEQDRIMEALRTVVNRLCLAEEGGRRSVKALREYRQALISAAVTGKLDVQQDGSHTARVVAWSA